MNPDDAELLIKEIDEKCKERRIGLALTLKSDREADKRFLTVENLNPSYIEDPKKGILDCVRKQFTRIERDWKGYESLLQLKGFVEILDHLNIFKTTGSDVMKGLIIDEISIIEKAYNNVNQQLQLLEKEFNLLDGRKDVIERRKNPKDNKKYRTGDPDIGNIVNRFQEIDKIILDYEKPIYKIQRGEIIRAYERFIELLEWIYICQDSDGDLSALREPNPQIKEDLVKLIKIDANSRVTTKLTEFATMYYAQAYVK